MRQPPRIPFTPGALNDLLARLVGEQLGVRLGQRVVVDNRPGAGTMLGSDLVAKSAADGYTLLLSSTPLAINPHLYAKVPFEATHDLSGFCASAIEWIESTVARPTCRERAVWRADSPILKR